MLGTLSGFRGFRPLFVLAFLSLEACASISYAGEPLSEGRPHHTASGFTNVHDYEQTGFFDFLKWRWNRLWNNIPSPETYNFPLSVNDPAFLQTNSDKTTLTWIGHATVLLQLAGLNVLTDPHFSERASPVQWIGPQRVVPPGLSMNDLPPIHVVVISHDHYDSLDKTTIKRLHEREGGLNTIFLVPLGLKPWFHNLGIAKVIESDWWDEHEIGGLRFIAVPVQHWSKRSVSSRNRTLWAGWAVVSSRFRFLFAGDSGYTPHFQEIGRRFGPFDLAAIPIGAYEPRWFMGRHHMTPEEAVQVHLDLNAKKSVAIHWGTFILTDEPLYEPPMRLEKEKKTRDLSPESFMVLKHGQTILVDEPGQVGTLHDR